MDTVVRTKRHAVVVTIDGEHTYRYAANLAEARRMFAEAVNTPYPTGSSVTIERTINGISIQQDSFES